ncbi:MAG: hypothetical protein KIT27_07660 [Legionellales bacterium]|nr:hypothetical protein [Legionellales bacterium]
MKPLLELNDYYHKWSTHTTLNQPLSRLDPFVDAFNVLEQTAKIITVTGTNGKGSVVALLESLCVSAGLRVGSLTSPHLLEFNERIRINQTPIELSTILTAFAKIDELDLAPSLFDAVTIAALMIFQTQSLDVIVLEVGVGGRLDACNIIDADVAVLTNIALDHQAILGNTRQAIGLEKIGIGRAHKPLVCGEIDLPAQVEKKCHELNLALYQIQRDYYFSRGTDYWEWGNHHIQLSHLSLPKIKLNNAATAFMAFDVLFPQQLPLLAHRALEHIQLRGRLEFYAKPQPTLIDVAHNPQACASLANEIQAFLPANAVLAIAKDKAVAECVQPLIPLIHDWHIAPLGTDRGIDVGELENLLIDLGVRNIVVYNSVTSAYQGACRSSGTIIVFGSFITAGEVIKFITRNGERKETFSGYHGI